MDINSYKADLKIVVVGNSGTGKTSFCNRWVKNYFSEKYRATIMSDFSYKIFKYNGFNYKIQLWDLAGQDKNIHTTKILAKNAHGCLIFSDITNIKTKNDTLKWKASLDENSNFPGGEEPSPCFLIENKIDLVSEEVVKDTREVAEFSERNGFLNFFRTSAKTGENIEEVMGYILTYTIDKLEEEEQKNGNANKKERDSVITLAPNDPDTVKKLDGNDCEC